MFYICRLIFCIDIPVCVSNATSMKSKQLQSLPSFPSRLDVNAQVDLALSHAVPHILPRRGAQQCNNAVFDHCFYFSFECFDMETTYGFLNPSSSRVIFIYTYIPRHPKTSWEDIWTLKIYQKHLRRYLDVSGMLPSYQSQITSSMFPSPWHKNRCLLLVDLRGNDFLPSRLSKLTGLKLLTSARWANLSFWA